MDEDDKPTKLEKLSAQYGDLTVIRAIIQAIPYVGGPLDTLMSNGGQKWKMERAEHFLTSLDEQMRMLATPPKLTDLVTSEELYDLVHYSLEQAVKTRSSEKRSRFASIVRRQLAEALKWEESEAAAHLLADLSDTDIKILDEIANAPVCGTPFDGLRVAELELEKPIDDKIPCETFKPLNIFGAITGISQHAIRMSCSDLVSRGLLKDEGVGRYGGVAMHFFVATDGAHWFLDWIKTDSKS
ncbi:hypothetical protein K2X30_15760 [bacterium]|jgi:hypothetical protein|nr:hypothetical protein [bacterium]